MNYQNTYNKLIQKRQSEILTDGYYETHHILPKSLGGDNRKTNLVKLTPREHFIAHMLLAKIHGGNMWYAFYMMSFGKNNRNQRTYKVNSRLYEKAKLECAKLTSIRMRENPLNVNYTQEIRDKISQQSYERWSDEDYRLKMIKSRRKTHTNPIFKDNQREKALNAIDNMTKDEFREKYIISRPFRKQIKCIFNNKETIYPSLRDASRALKIERKTMQTSIRENRELSKGNFQGYKFEYC